MNFGTLVALALQAVRNPRETASTVLSLGIPQAALAPALGLTIVFSVLLTGLAEALAPRTEPGATLPPLLVAAALTLLLSAYVFGLYRTGRAMGGTGSLPETVLLTAFLQFFLLLAQLVEIALWVVAPPLAGLFVIAVAILAFWINVNFVDVLHGYGSLLKSLALIIVVSVGIALAFVILLALSGVSVQGT